MDGVNWFENTELSLESFMSDYWRKQPVEFRQGLKSTLNSLDIPLIYKDIIDLCVQDRVESRIISKREDVYNLSLGPFEKHEMTTALTQADSMLMVQGIDQHIPSMADLLVHQFNFIPRWRVEDIMVTVGGAGASCGPHFDHYDVFLFQICGTKQWHWDSCTHQDDELSLDADVRLLPSFIAEQSARMEPGDLLYIPPGAGHWGIAGEDSITLSIGIRNPTMSELVSSYTDDLLDNISGSETLDDQMTPDYSSISHRLISNLQTQYIDFVSNPDKMTRWFGRYMTELKEPELLNPISSAEAEAQMQAHRLANTDFVLTLPSRITHSTQNGANICFLNGEVLEFGNSTLALVEYLGLHRAAPTTMVFNYPENILFMTHLIEGGAIKI